MIAQRAVAIDGEGVTDPALGLSAGVYQIKVGKRRHARVRLR